MDFFKFRRYTVVGDAKKFISKQEKEHHKIVVVEGALVLRTSV